VSNRPSGRQPRGWSFEHTVPADSPTLWADPPAAGSAAGRGPGLG